MDPFRNKRVQSRYDELMKVGRHGHYETMFQIVREEIEREREKFAPRPQVEADVSEEQTLRKVKAERHNPHGLRVVQE